MPKLKCGDVLCDNTFENLEILILKPLKIFENGGYYKVLFFPFMKICDSLYIYDTHIYINNCYTKINLLNLEKM